MQLPRSIQLVYLARLRETFGKAAEAYTLPDDVHTVGDLVRTLSARGGVWAMELAPGRAFRIAVNHEVASPQTRVGPGDEVAVFPPVTGG